MARGKLYTWKPVPKKKKTKKPKKSYRPMKGGNTRPSTKGWGGKLKFKKNVKQGHERRFERNLDTTKPKKRKRDIVLGPKPRPKKKVAKRDGWLKRKRTKLAYRRARDKRMKKMVKQQARDDYKANQRAKKKQKIYDREYRKQRSKKKRLGGWLLKKATGR